MARITPNTLRLGVASLSLISAIAVYLFLRLDPPTMLEPFQSSEKWFVSHARMFGSLPSFFYTLSIGLLLGAISSNLSGARIHCLIWIAMALILELTQHGIITEQITGVLVDFLPKTAIEIIGPYWSRGVFDPLDLLATLIGGLLALVLLSCLLPENYDARSQ